MRPAASVVRATELEKIRSLTSGSKPKNSAARHIRFYGGADERKADNMKTVGNRTVYGALGGAVAGLFVGGPIGLVIGAVLGGGAGNLAEPVSPAAGGGTGPAPGTAGAPVAPGLNAGDVVVYDATIPGIPDPPADPFQGGIKDVPIMSVISDRDKSKLVAQTSVIPAMGARIIQPLSSAGLILLRVAGIASPTPGSIVLAFSDPRLNVNVPGSLPVPLAGIVMKLDDPPHAP